MYIYEVYDNLISSSDKLLKGIKDKQSSTDAWSPTFTESDGHCSRPEETKM